MSDEPTCATCRRVMDPSEAKVFTVCDACWDDIYAKAAGSDSNHFREDARLRAYRDERDTARRDLAAARELLGRWLHVWEQGVNVDVPVPKETRAFLAGLPTPTPGGADLVTRLLAVECDPHDSDPGTVCGRSYHRDEPMFCASRIRALEGKEGK